MTDHRYGNATAWNDRGKYYWADLDDGDRHGPFPNLDAAHQHARLLTGKANLLLYGSCPDRFCRPAEPGPICFTQQMAETYSDNH